MNRNVYLETKDLKTIKKTLKSILNQINYSKSEKVNVKDSLNRVLFDPIKAKVSSPFYNASAMDGYAISAFETFNATEETPVNISNFSPINTGDELPIDYDAVVMIEDAQINKDKSMTLIKSIRAYENVRPIGEDIVKDDIILQRNHKIRPIDISVMLSSGIDEIDVYKKPTVAIIPTGDEIIRDVKNIRKGKIIDSNSYYLQNELTRIGAEPVVFEIVKDKYLLLEKIIIEACNNYDVVLVGAGSSAGSKDYAKKIVEKNGRVFAHGISIKPGKPTIIGMINETPIIGVPGYPVSTYIVFEEVIQYLILGYINQFKPTPTYIKARLSMKIYSSLKHFEFVRMKIGYINNEFVATQLDRKAGSTRSVVDADGILEIPKNSEGYNKDTTVNIRLLKDIESIKKSLVVIGSHDIIIDTIHDLMENEGYNISSSHVGSFAGVLAIKSECTHIAPSHLLHTDGTYNTFLIDKYLNKDYVVIKGVNRNQGLYVKKGNPKKIKSLKDLTRKDITFVNRQKGSGTRTLLDYLFKKENINADKIKGYDFELTTHTLIANSVLDERFDTGLGIESVAYLNNLEFINLGTEEYDFIIKRDSLELDIVKSFIKTLKSDKFAEALSKIPGYSLYNIGELKGSDIE